MLHPPLRPRQPGPTSPLSPAVNDSCFSVWLAGACTFSCGYTGVWVLWNTRPLSHTSPVPQPSPPSVDDKTQSRWVTAGYLRAWHKGEAAPWRPRGERLEPHRLTRAFYTPDKATFESRASWPSPPSHRQCPQPRTAQHQTRVGPSAFVCFEAGCLASDSLCSPGWH